MTRRERGWSIEALRPYVERLFVTFGPDRLIFGIDAVDQLASGLS
jgi:predicted TIM-barrel fold metal-dependent hydrolase